MVAGEKLMLPLHELLAQMQAWRTDRSDARRDALRTSLERLAASYQASGVFLATDMAVVHGRRFPFVRDAAGRVEWVQVGLRLLPRADA